ncbi:hypothetical protein [Rhizobium laguerreae]|uniref:hypothetical protein n=1 Tax=Rhizobium laguerreae TaxID=1076926 RepID=UPI001C8FD81F|nr:hypothetical protein [Rhizobium laguerreae]MBY3314712.1 hypothetical protein [Rhizobium laguerreae]
MDEIENERPLTQLEIITRNLIEMRQQAEARKEGSKRYRAKLDEMGWKPVGSRVRHV